jgi:hypothetical protein
MSATIRLAFLLITLPLVALVVAPVAGWLARSDDSDPRQPNEAPASPGPLSEADRGARLDARRDTILRRFPATEEIGQGLAERRLSVREAAQRLRALHEGDTRFWEALSLRVGRDEEERLARHAIFLAVQWLEDEPERSRALRQSLEAELYGAPDAGRAGTP